MGYSPQSKGYLCYDQSTKTLYTSKHILFNEEVFPFGSTLSAPSSSQYNSLSQLNTWLSNLLYTHSSNAPSILGPIPQPNYVSTSSVSSPFPTTISDLIKQFVHSPISSPPSTSLSTPSPPDPIPIAISTTSTLPLVPTTTNSHPMQTRSKSGITKPKVCYASVLDYTYTEPPTFKIASKYPQWCSAMDFEFQAL